MDVVRRWVPLLGTVVLVVVAFLRGSGLVDQAQAESIAAGVTAAAIAAAAGVVLKVRSEVRKARSGRTSTRSRAFRLLLLAALGAQATACASMDGLRLGSQPRPLQPDAETVESFVCRGDEAGAVAYLHAAEFRYLGEAGLLERLEAARAAKARGDCPCPGKACTK